jgi:hypothetical protein
MNEELYYEPGYDDFDSEPYLDTIEEALASIGWSLDEQCYNPSNEF